MAGTNAARSLPVLGREGVGDSHSVHDAAERAEAERRLGTPERVEGSGVMMLVYRTAEGTELRLGFGPGLLWVRETHRGAERVWPRRPRHTKTA